MPDALAALGLPDPSDPSCEPVGEVSPLIDDVIPRARALASGPAQGEVNKQSQERSNPA